jgi:pimeloyl-ACP methyl ester carboxylesterase
MFAGDMKHLLDSLNITNTNILGWSDGGITGLIMAIKYPSYVNKLAIMGANLFPTYEALKDTVFDGVNDLLDQIKDQTDANLIVHRRLLELILNEPHLTFDELKTIRSPTLVMAGEDDLVVEGHTRAIAKNIPGSELVILKNATHFAPVYNVAEFNEAVLNFFNN